MTTSGRVASSTKTGKNNVLFSCLFLVIYFDCNVCNTAVTKTCYRRQMDTSLTHVSLYIHVITILKARTHYGYVAMATMVTCCCERLTIAYRLLQAIYWKINPWTILRRFLTCKKICLSFHGSLRVSTSCYELLRVIYGYQRAIYGCLRLTTSWRSVRTRKKNPYMWRGISGTCKDIVSCNLCKMGKAVSLTFYI